MPHFYKYCTAATGRIVLRNRTLRWSTPRVLNDPADMQFDFGLKIDRQNVLAMGLKKLRLHFAGAWIDRPLNDMGRLIRSAWPQHSIIAMTDDEFAETWSDALNASLDALERSMPAFNDEVAAFARNAKVLCLSRSATSPLMWAHYADSSRGVVLRFPGTTEDDPLTEARPVQYVDEVPQLFDDEMFSDVLAGYEGRAPSWIMEQVIYTKSSHWSYEEEWRVCSGDGRSRAAPYEDLPFGAHELDGVIFGSHMSDTDREAIRSLIQAHYPHVEFLQAGRTRASFGVEISPAA